MNGENTSSPSSSPAPYYDYCRAPELAKGSKPHTQAEGGVYATIENPRQPPHQVENGDDRNYYSIGNVNQAEQYDYTAIYEDPTSPSYVVSVQNLGFKKIMVFFCFSLQSEVYSSGSVFDSAGTCVPTLVSCVTIAMVS